MMKDREGERVGGCYEERDRKGGLGDIAGKRGGIVQDESEE